jgi:hypothetical protein
VAITRTAALKAARKKWGTKAWVELRRDALTGEDRKRVSAELKALRERQPDPKTAPVEERRAYHRERERLMGEVLTHRCSLGYMLSLGGDVIIGRAVHGYGDTWEEALKQAGLI